MARFGPDGSLGGAEHHERNRRRRADGPKPEHHDAIFSAFLVPARFFAGSVAAARHVPGFRQAAARVRSAP